MGGSDKSIVEGVIFDFDGVLYDPYAFLKIALPKCVDAMMEAGLARRNPDVGPYEVLESLERIRKNRGSNADNHFDLLCKKYNGHSERAIVSAGRMTYHDAKFKYARPVEGAIDLLDYLKTSGHPIAICSNGIKNKQHDKFFFLKINKYFREEVNGDVNYHLHVEEDGTGHEKPHPYAFKTAAYDLGADPMRCIMVGDKIGTDILGANLLGMTTVWVRGGKHSDGSLSSLIGDASRKLAGSELFDYLSRNFESSEIERLMTPDYEISTLMPVENYVSQSRRERNGLPAVVKEIESSGFPLNKRNVYKEKPDSRYKIER